MHGSLPGTKPALRPNTTAAYVLTISAIGALGGLLFGYDWVVIGGAKPFFEKYFQLNSEALVGWANSCALLGCLLGSMISGGLSDRFGRKKGLLLSAVLFAVSSVLTGWAATFRLVRRLAHSGRRGHRHGVRHLADLHRGNQPGAVARTAGGPEPADHRDRHPGGPGGELADRRESRRTRHRRDDPRSPGTASSRWRWMFTAVAVPVARVLLFRPGVPESPRWLVKNGRREQAVAHAGAHRRSAPTPQKRCARSQAASRPRTPERVRLADLLAPSTRKMLVIGVALAVLQQWSGINVIFNYAEEIYRNAGYGVNDILFNIVITGAINLVCTLIAMATRGPLRPPSLMLFGCAGIGISHLLLGLAYRAGLKGLPVLVLTLCHHRLLRHVAGAGGLGADRRDLPEPHPRRGGFGSRLGALDRLLYADLHLSSAQPCPRRRRDLLAVRRDLLRRPRLRLAGRPRNRASRWSRSRRTLRYEPDRGRRRSPRIATVPRLRLA